MARLKPLLILGLCVAAATSSVSFAAEPVSDPAQDFDELCRFVAEEYAYFDLKKTRWDAVCAAYRPRAAAAADRTALIAVLESALGELYDAHAHLSTSTPTSPRLVPSGAELWAAWEGDTVKVVEVRAGSAAAGAGLEAGMEILAIDDRPIAVAVAEREPRFLSEPDDRARSWALQSVLAGRQDDQPIRLAVRAGGSTRTIEYRPSDSRSASPLSFGVLPGGLGHVELHNSLGDDATVAAFDRALEALRETRGLILDLRGTPSGGTSRVARGILGRLVGEAAPYQVHELVAEERASGIRRRWVELVMPRGATYSAPVVVLVGRWTGSMGEGLAIGLDAARGAPVVGAPMAHLLGALGEATLPASGIVVRIPTEKLFHVDGTPREAFVPRPALDDLGPEVVDPVLETGIRLLTRPVVPARTP